MILASTALALTAIGCSLLDASDDKKKIDAGAYVDHYQGLVERAVICTVCVVLFCAVLTFNGYPILIAAPTTICWASIYAITFRLRLNTLRGLEPTYVSLSNVYDSIFIRLFGHRAGIAAYTFEAIALAASTAIGAIIYYRA